MNIYLIFIEYYEWGDDCWTLQHFAGSFSDEQKAQELCDKLNLLYK